MTEKEYLNINDDIITIKNKNYTLTNSEKNIVNFFSEIDYKQYDKNYPHYSKPKLYGFFKTSENILVNRLTIKNVEFSNYYTIDDIEELLRDLRILPYSIKEIEILIRIEKNSVGNIEENFEIIFDDFHHVKNIIYNKNEVYEGIIEDEKIYSITFTILKMGIK